jgi:hypothetical protein
MRRYAVVVVLVGAMLAQRAAGMGKPSGVSAGSFTVELVGPKTAISPESMCFAIYLDGFDEFRDMENHRITDRDLPKILRSSLTVRGNRCLVNLGLLDEQSLSASAVEDAIARLCKNSDSRLKTIVFIHASPVWRKANPNFPDGPRYRPQRP